MEDNGSIFNIIYLDAFKWMGLGENDLSPAASSLYGFNGDHVIPKGTTKLTVIVGEHL